MNTKLIACVSLALALVLATPGLAAAVYGDTGSVTIQHIGCQADNCFVYISQPPNTNVFPAACPWVPDSQIRFSTTTQSGRNTLSLLTATFLAGKTVSIRISAACSGAFATIDWFTIAR